MFCNTTPRSLYLNKGLLRPITVPQNPTPSDTRVILSLKPVLLPFGHFRLYKIRRYGNAVVSNGIIIPTIFLS